MLGIAKGPTHTKMHTTPLSFLILTQHLIVLSVAIPALPQLPNAQSLEFPSQNLTINNPSETTLTGSRNLASTYNVPQSDVQIRHGYIDGPSFCCELPTCHGPINPRDFGTLLVKGAQTQIFDIIKEFGDAMRFRGTFTVAIISGLKLWIHQIPPPNRPEYSVGQLWDVVEGLIHLTLERRIYCEIGFEFWGKDQWGTTRVMGQGWIKQGAPRRPL